jgi:hypothetical protein
MPGLNNRIREFLTENEDCFLSTVIDGNVGTFTEVFYLKKFKRKIMKNKISPRFELTIIYKNHPFDSKS